jgi:hypothetical protein
MRGGLRLLAVPGQVILHALPPVAEVDVTVVPPDKLSSRMPILVPSGSTLSVPF